jgi:hypothetical protein
VKVSVNESNVTEIFKNVEKTRSQKQETYKMTKIDENTTRIEVVYDEIDHSKTKLIQKVRNEAYIDIINTGSEVKIRHTANQRVSDIKDDIVECISKITKKDIQPVVITFEGIRDTTLRTLFFTKLINSIQGYNLENVSKVKLSSKDSISDDEMEEVEGLEDAATCFIKKASYDGDNLLNSPEYKQLEKKGYFITCIKWVSLEKGKNPNKIEMEALFDQPEKGSGYKYSVKGIYKLKNAGYTQLRPVQEDEETPLLSKIETASNKIFQEIIKEEFLKKVN